MTFAVLMVLLVNGIAAQGRQRQRRHDRSWSSAQMSLRQPLSPLSLLSQSRHCMLLQKLETLKRWHILSKTACLAEWLG